MTSFDTGPEVIDHYARVRLTLAGRQYDVYLDTDALSTLAGRQLIGRDEIVRFATSISDRVAAAADRKRIDAEPEDIIVIDDASEI